MKSNIEYLKESVGQQTEWIEGIEKEIKSDKTRIQELEGELSDKEIIIDNLKEELEEAEEENNDGLNMIDFGYDKLYWKSENGNLKIQDIMEDFNKKYGIREMEEA